MSDNMKIKKSKAIAFSSILTALCVLIMLIGSVADILDLSSAALASFCVIFAVMELGRSYASVIYLASSVISLLLLPVKTPSLFFAAFFGIYPLIKSLAERIGRIASWVIKLMSFAASLSVTGSIFLKLFLSPDSVRELEKYGIFLVFAAFAVFVLYDVTLTYAISAYLQKFRSKFGIGRLMK